MHSHRIATWRCKNVGETRDAPSVGASHGLTPGGDTHAALLAAGGEEVEEVLAISVAEEDSLTVVAALSDVQPVAGGSETVFAWHKGLQ